MSHSQLYESVPGHVHGCLKCRPEMVPDFDPTDERYHHHEKCGRLTSVKIDGAVVTYTTGVFEGVGGWVLDAGKDQKFIHQCGNCFIDELGANENTAVCVEPRFGRVEVVHECPAVAAERERVIKSAVRL